MKKNKLLTTLAIVSIVMFAGCKNDDYVAIDGGPCPVVISVTPVSGATLVGRSAVNASEQAARTTLVTATFNKKMDAKTINGSTFIVKVTGGAEVDGNVTYNAADSTAIFTASGKFADNTTYEARVTTGVKDPMGNALQEDKVWPFSTGTTILPVITATSPANLATNVAWNKVITATFSVPMDQSTLTTSSFTLMNGANPVLGTVATTGTVSSFTPNANLNPLTVYTAKISMTVKNMDGTAIAKDTTWTFTTADVVPRVITTDPTKAATLVPLNKTVSAIFSVAMNSTTLTTSTFMLKRSGIVVNGVVGYTGTTATFNPNNDLLSNTVYTATIKAGVKNTNGTPLAKDTVWTFTTATVLAPFVTSTDPSDQDANVTLSQNVMANFNETMDNTTITSTTFSIMEGLNPVLGTVTYSGTTATFNPNSDFVAGKTYTARITNGVKNLTGTNMLNDYVWSFSIPTVPIVTIDILKSVGRFGIFAGVGISNNAGPSVINNLDVGIDPGVRSSVTGFPPATLVNGAIYCYDDLAPAGTPAMLDLAKADLVAAYLYLEGATAPAPATVSGDQGGKTLAPGIYKSTSTLLIQNGDLTLDAQGDPNAVFIFQVASAFTTVGGAGGSIILTGGAQAKNVYWQTGSSATIGDYTDFYGNVVALQSITMGAYSNAVGRMLARNGSVTMTSTNTISKP
ncbi:MAG: Ig-like domain-containing protein [Paludibacter sp.]